MSLTILQVHNRYREPGGEDAVVRNEGDLLRARGHHVELHEVENPDDARASAVLAMQAVANRGSVRDLEATLARVQPDVVHLHNWWFRLTPAVIDAVVDRGIPLVATAHNHRLGCADATFFRDGAICTRCLGGSVWRAVPLACHRESRAASAAVAATIQAHRRRGTWDRVDRWLPLSDAHADLLATSGVDRNRMTVKPNTTPDPGSRASSPSTSRQVVFLGRIVEEKGLGVLLEAWRRAAPDLELVVVGDGELRAELEAGAPAGVTFRGRITPSEVATLLGGARALAFPIQWLEPFGMVMVEAMSHGTPVVASDLGAVGDVLGTEAGWRTDPTVEAWAAALANLNDDADVDRRGQAARDRYLERFTPDVVVGQLERVYASVRDEGRSARASRRT